MKSIISATIDVLRIFSALLVFAGHCAQHWNEDASRLIQPYSHHAVIVFFVISGYVITFSTLNNNSLRWQNYAVARLSRLYSVLIPALIVTLTLQLIGTMLAPDVYAAASRGTDALRYTLAALFLQSSWMLSAAPPTNGPLWSLSYEAWYYIAFGAAIFSRPGIIRIGMVTLVCAIAGPNILLLAPAWLAGVALFQYERTLGRRRLHGAIIFALGTVVVITAATLLADLPYSLGRPRLFYSASFLSDGIFAIGVAMVIGSLSNTGIEVPQTLVKRLRLLGDYTFPLYLMHFPIIFFFTAITGYKADTLGSALTHALPILALVLGISNLTERARAFWRSLFQRLLSGANGRRWNAS